jgi:hypothetical protein
VCPRPLGTHHTSGCRGPGSLCGCAAVLEFWSFGGSEEATSAERAHPLNAEERETPPLALALSQGRVEGGLCCGSASARRGADVLLK